MSCKYQSFLDNLHNRFPDCYFHTEIVFAKDITGDGFRFDFGLKCCRIAIEVEGGATAGFGHRNIKTFLKDMRKYNLAAILGWRVLRFTPSEIYDSKTLDKIDNLFHNSPCPHSTLNNRLRRLFL
jgi:very-short-patch-repair endonuclease